MPRPRLPAELARIKGASLKDPKRHAKKRDPNGTPLGKPAQWMAAEAKKAWEAFRRELPWLMESDRTLVEIASLIRGKLMAGEPVGITALNQLRMCAAQMGATPADRSKISVPNEAEEEDAADRFFN
jgi:phage terminase small subunit